MCDVLNESLAIRIPLFGLNTALMCGIQVDLLRDGFCVFAGLIITISYSAECSVHAVG